jgi:SET domain-containing protein
VRESRIHGKGLFANERISKDEIVCIKGGSVFDRETLKSMASWYRAAEIQVGDDLFIGPRSEDEREGSMIFSNHSCDPNIGIQGQIVFIAMREIEAGEELTHDWATTDDDDYEVQCNCGATSCRKRLTGKDWQRKDLQEKYAGYFSWYLERKIRHTPNH